MALNPTTGIDPEIDRFVIWRPSTSQYTNMNATWPRTDGGQIVGANPDFEYYKKVESSQPDVDHRYRVTSEYGKTAITPTPAVGLPQGTYSAQHSVTKRDIAELKAQVETEFERQFSLSVSLPSISSQLTATMDAVVRKQNGATLTPKQQAKRDAAVAIGDKVAKLEARRDALLAAIDADQD